MARRITLRELLCLLFGYGCPPPPPKKNIAADHGRIALKTGQSEEQ